MKQTLDVLVIESHPRAATLAVAELEAAGHRIHRCYAEGQHGFPCRAVSRPGSCPIDGNIDVALVVRPRVAPRPTGLEAGVGCVIRAGIPIVEDGPDILDPFEPWIDRRINGPSDAVRACREAADAADGPIRARIKDRIRRVATAARIEPSAIRCRLERNGPSLDVHLYLPATAAKGVEQALAVRVLDAVRSVGQTFGNVDVHVHRS